MDSILVVDDERSMRDFLKILLTREGYKVHTAPNGTDALKTIADQAIDLVITDIRMPTMGGLELLDRIKQRNTSLPVIMITAFASPDDAVQAMKNGAYDYISKPFNVDEIKTVIKNATSQTPSRFAPEQNADDFPEIVGESREMQKIFELITRIAPSPATVMIYGESGTGKELVAQAIHKRSTVKDKPFIPITCSAIPEDLMESELFGHMRGSFTGAISDKLGLFQEAHNGTAFLDEIGELTPIIQTKLLRVLQEREIKPVGATRHIPINVRIIAATNRVLEEEIAHGRFREDLFYRLAVVPIRVPALRERKSDIPLLIDHFLAKYSSQLHKQVREISSYALEVLMNYDFPGNVRELENIIERGVALESSNIILPENLTLAQTARQQSSTPASSTSNTLVAISKEELYERGLDEVISEVEKKCIEHGMKAAGNSKTKAADMLKVSFRSLRYKAKKYGM
ncbi:MAG: sigma-54-dependent Fis family transcriptional regulator [Desulfofustis sp. PB-SRB1]|jgi:two-component system response regulator PilR (NtrC family)|nr:sigma-54-dependent Fis family transcriptional regulator [Desulfofustis sp. PB-SRB1]MBM1003224.1 sigma-54-dependent Fis family transcriptional regulator [Desulfofustis sp. PB-SRB1]HBH29425.1 Fis family transcriptional regulator [Desulfofustis sp.]HBH30851.1 Fis family transcriptional regulator [Desulfofustis sp.]